MLSLVSTASFKYFFGVLSSVINESTDVQRAVRDSLKICVVRSIDKNVVSHLARVSPCPPRGEEI